MTEILETLRSPNGLDVRIHVRHHKQLKAAGLDVGALADEAHKRMWESGETSVHADFGDVVMPFHLKSDGGKTFLLCDGPMPRSLETS